MALNAYIAATNRLLQNPVPASNPLYTTADLTVYINEARQQLAAEAECVRASSTGLLVNTQQNYPFSLFSVFSSGNVALTGISGVIAIRQMSVTVAGIQIPMTNRSWPWFNRYYVMTGAAAATGTPNTWAQQGRGTTKGTFGVSPIPTSGLTINVDAACVPVDLADDTTPEAIPAPFTTAIQFYAAFKAYLSSQRRDDATVMFNRYTEFMRRAIQENTSTVLPGNQPGGAGAQIAGSRAPLTSTPQAQGGR